MQLEDFDPFKSLLGELFGAIDKPLTDAKIGGFFKGLERMDIATFERCQASILLGLSELAAPKTFTVNDIWAEKKRLRARTAVPAKPERPAWVGDAWDAAANKHLLALMLRRLMRRQPGFDEAQTRQILMAKNEWAKTMRESVDARGEVDLETQRALWSFHVLNAVKELPA